MEQLNHLTRALKKRVRITGLAILMMLLLLMAANAQNHSRSNKVNKKYHRASFKKNETRLVRACRMLKKKRNHIPRKSVLASHRKPKPHPATDRSIMQIDKSDVTANAQVKPVVKKLPINPKVEHVSDEKLVTLHKKEDEVLANNHLPVPTSEKHEEVRKRVSDKLASKLNVYPLTLEPLYFQFNQDEFSVVDMEPFLMAAEYALQGRTILIEGHTDSRGQDDFNVKLSIKRVQKIRQLMLDMGVPDERISVVGYGEELGKEKSKTEDDHQNDRRVDFTVF
jgi:outer membrane protein OmpA-like peptidoglycan-associated protein